MFELKTKQFEVSMPLKKEIKESFNKPIVFYMAHDDDELIFFLTFVIVDFKNEKLVYIVSYYPENIALLRSREDKENFRIRFPSENPHCSISTSDKKSFLTFTEGGRHFTHTVPERNVIEVYTGRDIGFDGDEEVINFGSTFYKDDEDPDYFYMTAVAQSKKDRTRKLYFIKISLDLKRREIVYSRPTNKFYAPHSTRRFGKYLLTSSFLFCQVENKVTGQVFENSTDYMRFVYRDLYKEYCQSNALIPSSEIMTGESLFFEKKLMLDSGFNSFFYSKGKNFLDICTKFAKYDFIARQGKISTLNLDTKEITFFNTSFCTPAHFEVDKLSDDIFISAHNFLSFGRMYFLGPAAIDRFRPDENGNMRKIASFSHPTGFRFATHNVFAYQGKTYISTFGQPNRLFIIDADTMKLHHYHDIETDVLTDKEDPLCYINTANLESITIRTIEASDDGRYLFLLSHDYIYIYDFRLKRIVSKIEYHPDISFGDDLWPSQFYKRTTHSNFID